MLTQVSVGPSVGDPSVFAIVVGPSVGDPIGVRHFKMDPILERLLSRGGARQQQEVAAAASSVGRPASNSVLADRLLTLFGWGVISANTAQWIADGAVQDGLCVSEVQKLAKLGSGGKFSGNCRRDLFRAFSKELKLPKPLLVNCTTLSKTLAVEESGLAVLPISEFAQGIYQQYPTVFSALLAIIPRTSGTRSILRIQSW